MRLVGSYNPFRGDFGPLLERAHAALARGGAEADPGDGRLAPELRAVLGTLAVALSGWPRMRSTDWRRVAAAVARLQDLELRVRISEES